uniref:Uncharacterized protein n=1 Tax=Strombidium inclinatum TaxID=197538 RepID=A0A7S3MW68_9SPIT|mmetsp:Transcript_21733/g.33539  ORF Transcript_21733/g.33539 Transcript_21733/m.33539 type:complete len:185 (+) Transcript_21733:417-971(+)
MPEPTDPKQKKKIQPTPDYPDLDSDDEEDETVETRKSVKSAEKQLHQRFFINAKDKRDYEKKAIEGRISTQELDFAEHEDQEIGQDPKEVEAKQAAKKAKAEANAEKYLADKNKSEAEKKEETKAAAEEKKIEDAKKPTPAETAGGKSPQAQGKEDAAAFLPPELNPNAAAFAMTSYDDYDERW